MANSETPYAIPGQLKVMLTLVMSIVTAVLYVLVLGGAVLKTLSDTDPTFSTNAVRAAGLLSGLVGAVVTAGFAGSRNADAASGVAGLPVVRDYPATASRARVKMAGLARMMGFPSAWVSPSRGAVVADDPLADTGGPEEGKAEDGSQAITLAGLSMTVWVALLYFVVYSLVGLAAFLLTAFRPEVPDIVSNSAWVWLGTVLTSSYSFFGLDSA